MSSEDSLAWHNLRWAGLGVVLSMSTWFSATAILPDLVAVWGLSIEQSAWLTNAVQLGFVVGALLSAALALADVMSPLRLMTLSALLAAAANGVLLLEPTFYGAVAARFVTGAALAGLYPTAMKFVSTWFKQNRGLAMGTMVGALTLGSALPHLARTVVEHAPWHIVITVSSLATLGAAFIFARLLREGPGSALASPLKFGHLVKLVRNRPVMLANVGYFGHMWELYALWGWIMAYALSASQSGLSVSPSLLAFAVVAIGAPGCVIAGLIADRIGRCATTALILGVSASCALVIGMFYEGPAWLFMGVALIWGLMSVADSAQFTAAVSELSDPSYVGTALAFQMGIGFAITMVSIELLPRLAEAWGGWQWTFLLLVPGPLIGMVSMLLLRRHPKAQKLAGGRR